MELQILERNEATYIKLPVEGMATNVKLLINYESARNDHPALKNLSSDKSFDLTIYKSNMILKPDAIKNEYETTIKPKTMIFCALDPKSGIKLPSFTNEYIYVAFESKSGCSISVTLKCQNMKNKKTRLARLN